MMHNLCVLETALKTSINIKDDHYFNGCMNDTFYYEHVHCYDSFVFVELSLRPVVF